jgi:hypothetical protein
VNRSIQFITHRSAFIAQIELMFCPKCATANPDQAKFCRACGTNLETVAQALGGQSVSPKKPVLAEQLYMGDRLGGQSVPTSKTTKKNKKKDEEPNTREDWIKKRAKGVRQIIQGVVLFAFSLLVGGVGMQITIMSGNDLFAWLAMWTVFFGWLAVWGLIAATSGIGDMIESKAVLREMGLMTGTQAVASTTPLVSAAEELQMIPNTLSAAEPVPPPSVTEHTTVSLNAPCNAHSETVVEERQKEPQ